MQLDINFNAFIKAKQDFLEAAKRTYESGIQTGTGGNLSVRIPGTNLMIVKPSGYSYGQCTEEKLCITDFDGNKVEDDMPKPTRECTLHGNLYKRYPDIGGIVHTHSPYAIMNSLKYSEIELVTMHSNLKLKNAIPVVDVRTQAVTEDELPKVFEVLDNDPDRIAFVLRGHGIVAIGKTCVKAEQTAELIEETSMIHWEVKNAR